MLPAVFRHSANALSILVFSTNMAFAQATEPTAPLTVKLGGYLNKEVITDFSKQLRTVRAQNPDKKIRVEISDSQGGEIDAGFTLAETLYSVGNLDLVCRGNIQSMTASVFVSFQGGKRIAAPDCTNITMHDLIQHIWSPTPGARLIRSQIVKEAENMTQAMLIMSKGVAQAANMPHSSAQALFGYDCHLTPDKAYKIGLIDDFENRAAELPTRIPSPTAAQIYEVCDTTPIMDSIQLPDWSHRNFGLRPDSLAKN
jgi:ATP-dependent protease ClpP protease subunit